ncbi:TPM domain-containing protein [Alsobacter sp. SYSU BS001988]
MTPLLTQAEHDRVAAAIRAAEAATDAEIVCVLARRASDWRFVPVVYAAAAALLLPWVLVFLTAWSVQQILLAQLAVFAAVAALLFAPALRYRLVPRATARRRAHQAAAEQFLVRGLGRTEGRTGVLIFVAVAERYACVIPDQAVAAVVPEEVWRRAIERLTDALRAGRPADGLEGAVRICAEALEQRSPARPGDRNELPDRVIEY